MTARIHDAGPATRTRALVILPLVPPDIPPDDGAMRRPEDRLEEAKRLAEAIRLKVPHEEVIRIARSDPSTLFGRGNALRIAGLVEAFHTDLIIVDHLLTPVQQRNLERLCMAKVIDRASLILENLGAHAHTREGQLRVELAALSHQKSRLVRSWTHLVRQRGGFGFLGSPGEIQLERDRRLIAERIAGLTRELDEIRQSGAPREDGATPLVALVGYIGSGKSALLDALADVGSQVRETQAGDGALAMHNPMERQLILPSGHKAILWDTVDLVSDLPQGLAAPFHAVLEELRLADVILHVRDISHPDSEARGQHVEKMLAGLGIDATCDGRVVEVLSKADHLEPIRRGALAMRLASMETKGQDEQTVAVSAAIGDGLSGLLDRIDRCLSHSRRAPGLDSPEPHPHIDAEFTR
jgi:GTP-binding protein HflX